MSEIIPNPHVDLNNARNLRRSHAGDCEKMVAGLRGLVDVQVERTILGLMEDYNARAREIEKWEALVGQLQESHKKLHRRAQLAEAALPEWKEICSATAGQATGRFFPALLRCALADAELENTELRAVLKKYQARYHGAPHAKKLWERAQKVLSGGFCRSARASSEVNGIGTQLGGARANAAQMVTDSSPAQDPSTKSPTTNIPVPGCGCADCQP